jgi:hypothetical protein
MPCAYCGRADGSVYRMNDLGRASSFDPSSGEPRDCPSVYLHEQCVAAFFARSNGQMSKSEAEPVALGLSRRRIQELADWYSDQGYQRYGDNSLNTAALDAELRENLQEKVTAALEPNCVRSSARRWRFPSTSRSSSSESCRWSGEGDCRA